MSMRASSAIIGGRVVTPAGEDLGRIEDLVLDVESGDVEYAVLSVGGILGLGERYFAVPLAAMPLDAEAGRFVLAVDKERLEQAPGFDKANWPSRPDKRFCDRVREYYRTR